MLTQTFVAMHSHTDLGAPHPRLAAAVSLCNPFNLTLGDWNWRRPDAGFRRAYDKYLAGAHAALRVMLVDAGLQAGRPEL